MRHDQVLESAEFIANNAINVTIPKESLAKTAQKVFTLLLFYRWNLNQTLAVSKQLVELMKEKHYSNACWKMNELHPSVADERALNW